MAKYTFTQGNPIKMSSLCLIMNSSDMCLDFRMSEQLSRDHDHSSFRGVVFDDTMRY